MHSYNLENHSNKFSMQKLYPMSVLLYQFYTNVDSNEIMYVITRAYVMRVLATSLKSVANVGILEIVVRHFSQIASNSMGDRFETQVRMTVLM